MAMLSTDSYAKMDLVSQYVHPSFITASHAKIKRGRTKVYSLTFQVNWTISSVIMRKTLKKWVLYIHMSQLILQTN